MARGWFHWLRAPSISSQRAPHIGPTPDQSVFQSPATPEATTAQSPQRPPPPAPSPPLAINLGIDFGTTFTKVVFRDVGTETSGIVTFDGASIDECLIPSIVEIDEAGRLSLPAIEGPALGRISIPFLKMRLAGSRDLEPLPRFQSVDLNSDSVIRAVSSWFLAIIIIRSRDWVLAAEADRAKGRRLQLSANVGVPVQYFDSLLLSVFDEVLSVAWNWALHSAVPEHLSGVVEGYAQSVASVSNAVSDCHAIPEIAAAVQSFVTSRDALPGTYIYFDIGGGTVDGVGFRYVNWDGERRINFFSGQVAHLGSVILATRFLALPFEDSIRLISNERFDRSTETILAPDKGRIRRELVGPVILTAKRKDPNDWERYAIISDVVPRKTIARLNPENMRPLPVFVGGGAAGSAWYQGAILSTYTEHQHEQAGIPPYELIEVPKPADLDMNGLTKPLKARR